jgi:hypothetical protein
MLDETAQLCRQCFPDADFSVFCGKIKPVALSPDIAHTDKEVDMEIALG